MDDQHFNIHYHLRHVALPKPGDAQQLKRLAARVMAQHLDRQKPLWEIWILEGLANPDHFAMISKVHHCMVDGMSSVALLNVMLTPKPTETCDRLPLDVAESLPRFIQETADPESGVRAGVNALRESVRRRMRGVTSTPLNQQIGPHRRLDWLTMSLEDVKGVKNRLGGTVNDVVLATVAGALRCFLLRRGVDVAPLDFRVMAPVSIRPEKDRDALGNQISAWMVPMPLDERDPLRRLDEIRATTEQLKHSNPALGAATLTGVGDWTPSRLLSLGARLAVRVLPFDLVVTNVPGPQQALYMLGAKMVDNFGFIPLVDSLCLGVVIFSYAGQLCWGFTAEWDLLPDLHDFVGDIEASFRDLCDAPERAGARSGSHKAAHAAPWTRAHPAEVTAA